MTTKRHRRLLTVPLATHCAATGTTHSHSQPPHSSAPLLHSTQLYYVIPAYRTLCPRTPHFTVHGTTHPQCPLVAAAVRYRVVVLVTHMSTMPTSPQRPARWPAHVLSLLFVLSLCLPRVSSWCYCAPSSPDDTDSDCGLGLDTSAFRVRFETAGVTPPPSSYIVAYTTSDCYHCAPQWLYQHDDGSPESQQVNANSSYCASTSRFDVTLWLLDAATYYGNATQGQWKVLAEATQQFTEFGFYTLYAHAAAGQSPSLQQANGTGNSTVMMAAEFITDTPGDNAYVAIGIVFPVLLALLLLVRALVDDRVTRYIRRVHTYLLSRDAEEVDKKRESESTYALMYHEEQQQGEITHRRTHSRHASTHAQLSEPILDADTDALPPLPPNSELHINTNVDPTTGQLLTPADAHNTSGGGGYVTKPANSTVVVSGSGVARVIKGKVRLLSLDSFRGLALTWMIFVNYGGGGYWFFSHAEWNGLTVADLLFPWFVWMMGCSMPMSFASLAKQGVGRRAVTLKVIRRAAILYLLGVCVSNGGDLFSQLRLMGVLQRFGLSYLIVGLILVHMPKVGSGRKVEEVDGEEVVVSPWQAEYVHHSLEYAAIVLLLFIHTLITFLLPVPGCPTGYLGPGGLADYGQYPNCVGGAAGYIDRQILGRHMYGSPTCQNPYQCGAYDPEGLLGILTSAGLCYFGVIAGRSILYVKEWRGRVKRWMLWCLGMGIVALILCFGQKEGGLIPVNKNLWSLSFICTLSCFAFALLSLLYLLIDVVHVWDGAPFRAMGQNSIMIYFLSEGLGGMWPFSWRLNDQNTHLTVLTQNVGSVCVFWFIAAYAAAHGFFINI